MTKADAAVPVQTQFLSILSREEAWARWTAALKPGPLGSETVPLLAALGRVSSGLIASPIDNPPFDRSGVDGFAVLSSDLASASDRQPVRLKINGETLHCGRAPQIAVAAGTATPIATGAPLPRGADGVVMVEWTDVAEVGHVLVRRAVAPGSFVGFAGSDIARGETLLRPGTLIGSREIAMLAACGIAEVAVSRRPRIAVISTGDELVQPGAPLPAAAVYDCNAPAVAAALIENGCEPTILQSLPDDERALAQALPAALAGHDALILSAGTSKGAGDKTYQSISALGAPGIIAHGVALKPGKPLCLAVCGGKPVVALPGFPTSAMFTLHDMVIPMLRIMAGLPRSTAASAEGELAVDVVSELGRREFVMVAVLPGADGLKVFPTGKGSGAVTSFAQADGFVSVDALCENLPAGSSIEVTRFEGRDLRAPDLTIIGSHCLGLEALAGALEKTGLLVRIIAAGSQAGLRALARGEADIAPIHLLDAKSGSYNRPFLDTSMRLISGWQRNQGFVFRRGDPRFAGRSAADALAAALADPECLMVNRNAGSGTRVQTDRLLAGKRPPGYANAPRSHNAVAAAIAQGRSDWGIAIEQAAATYGLEFIAIAAEHYDFAVAVDPRRGDVIERFEAALAEPETRAAIEAQGFRLHP